MSPTLSKEHREADVITTEALTRMSLEFSREEEDGRAVLSDAVAARQVHPCHK